MGYLFKDKCYDTLSDARDAAMSQQVIYVTPGATTYVARQFKQADGTWRLQAESVSSTGSISTLWSINYSSIQLPTCSNLDAFKDGQVLGWGIVAAIVAAWAIKNMKRGV